VGEGGASDIILQIRRRLETSEMRRDETRLDEKKEN
jgi:hypothetical protein